VKDVGLQCRLVPSCGVAVGESWSVDAELLVRIDGYKNVANVRVSVGSDVFVCVWGGGGGCVCVRVCVRVQINACE
jgi:hypothetical protein